MYPTVTSTREVARGLTLSIESIAAMNGGGHFLEWELNGPRGGNLGNGDEISGVDFALGEGKKLTFPEQAWYGHTEGKVISELMEAGKLRPGTFLRLKGTLPPCTNCQRIMQWTSKNFKIAIEYLDGNGIRWLWQNGVLIK